MKRALLIALAAGTLAGCSSGADDIGPAYISPVVYSNYSCEQISQEMARVSSAAARAAGVQDQKSSQDAVATGVAVVLFWPAAFLVSGGDGQNAAELAKLRGQKEALETASIQKKCGITFGGAGV